MPGESEFGCVNYLSLLDSLGIVAGVLQFGNVFVGQMKQPLKLANVQEKFMFEKWHTSNTHQVV